MANVLERAREVGAIAPVSRTIIPSEGRPSLEHVGGYLLLLNALGWLAHQGNRRVVPPTRTGTMLGDVAGEIGRGIVAGIAGTLAITLAGAIDQQIKRIGKPPKAPTTGGPIVAFLQSAAEPWLFAADTAGKILGVSPADEAARRRFAMAVHWSYGTLWGTGLGLMSLAGVRGPFAMGAILAGQRHEAEMVAMPAAKLFSPPRQWGRSAVISSVADHAAYAVAAGAVYSFMRR